jgi:hypothetical protein
MLKISSILLVFALVLAAVIGPQMRAWSWGPAMIPLGLAVLAAVPVLWRRENPGGVRDARATGLPSPVMVAYGLLVIGWFAWRAWTSPVAEAAHADMLLLAGAVAGFICVCAIRGSAAGERILLWGVAALLLAGVVVVWRQSVDAEFTPLFRNRLGKWPSVFAAHYNEGANFLIATSLLLGAAALFGKHAGWVRAFWGLIAIAGVVAVYFTRSRGGVLAIVAGLAVFGAVMLLAGARKKTRWFVPMLITLPLLGIGMGALLYQGWSGTVEYRSGGNSDVEQMMDDSRLPIYGMTLSCIARHPLTGGGSRSFSWESFHVFEPRDHGYARYRPDMTHNELLQTATDYGLAGFALVVVLLGIFMVTACVRVLFEKEDRWEVSHDALRIGGIAAISGMLVQSCFSFVFHLMPGVLLLGVCLGRAGIQRGAAGRPGSRAAAGMLSVLAVACAAMLLPWGWKGTMVTRELWPLYFKSGPAPGAEDRIHALGRAIDLWPQNELHQDRARLLQVASNEESDPDAARELVDLALADYHAAAALHPMDPTPVVNAANLYSRLGNDDEAARWYDATIALQGNMEPAFRGHYQYADHLRRKGIREFEAGDKTAALKSMEKAAAIFEQGVPKMAWLSREYTILRISLHESLGAAREATGDTEGALAAYDFATTLPGGLKAHYRAAVLLVRIAVEAWQDRRPGEALWYFEKAKQQNFFARNQLPGNVTPEDRKELVAYIDKTMAFLRGAGIQPKAPPGR